MVQAGSFIENCPSEKTNIYFSSLFDSMSNHMAKSVNMVALLKENRVAKAVRVGAYPYSAQRKISRMEKYMVNSVKNALAI